jgi:hypothetical protein
MSSKRFSLLEQVLLPALAAGMRTAWLVPVVNALFASGLVSPSGTHVPAWLPFVVLLVGSALARSLAGWPLAPVIVALAGLTANGLILLLAPVGAQGARMWFTALYRQATYWAEGVPAVWALLLLGVGLWLRAISMDWSETESLRKGFITGAFFLGLLIALSNREQGLGLVPGLGTAEAIFAFVGCGLGAFAAADISRTLRQSVRSAGVMPRLGKYWLVVLSTVILGVIALGWAAAALVAPETLLAILRWFSPVLNILATAVTYLAMALAWIFFTIFGPLLRWLRELAARNAQQEPLALATPNYEEQLRELQRQAEGTAGLPAWLQVMIALVLLCIVVLIFILALRRRFVSLADGVLESREVVFSLELAKEQLRGLFRRRRRRRGVFLPLDEEASARAQIRSAYRSVLALLAERGLPRERHQTPWGYAAALVALVPALKEPLQLLTHAYMLARYSHLPLDEVTVSEALLAAKEIETYLFRHELGPAEGAPQA